MTHRQRLMRVVASVAAILAVLAAGCADARPPEPAPPHGPPVLAFARPGELLLADAAGHTWRAAQLEVPVDQLVWSPDGARLVWLDIPQDGGAAGSLHIVDVASGEAVSHPCPCRGVGFLGEEVATLSADGTALLLFPPSGDPTRAALDAAEPPYSRVAASGRDRVAVAAPLPEQEVGVRGQSTLVTVDRNGRIRPLLPQSEMTSFIDALASPDLSQLAWVDLASGGACWNTASLPTIRYQGGKATHEGAPDDPAFRKALLTDQRLITSYAWAGQGLTVTFGPGPGCQAAYAFRFVSYYREGSTWTLLGIGWLGVGYGAEGRMAKVEAPNLVTFPKDGHGNGSMMGRLVLTDAAGAEKPLADDVSSFAFTPAEAAAARPPAGSSPQAQDAGEPALATTDDQGVLLSGPLYELAKRIFTAAAAGDVNELLNLCAACDDDTIAWLRSPDGPRQVIRSMQTHPTAAPQEGLLFPGLAGAPCVDDIAKGLACTAEQIQDAAILNLKSDSDLDYGDRVYTASRDISIYVRYDAAGNAQWIGHLRDPQMPPRDDCLTPQEFVEAMRRIPGYFTGPIQPGTEVVCEDFTAASKVTLNGEPADIVLARSEGGWNGTNFNGASKRSPEECATLPSKIHAYLKNACG